ncbi:MAG: enoyl-CoA hydratase/isomerase family protein [Salinisphaeraceae bacterium]|nr:enoyl-CoA hydratase/isomerase family protein [Salinisphaeraceae bacterium]
MLDQIPHDDILELRLNKPPVNALGPELNPVLRDAILAAPADGARALVLSGRDGMFSAGLDVAAMLKRDRAGMVQFFTDFFGLLAAVARSPIPIAAAITGHAPAGGAVLAILSDYRVMLQGKYRIGLNEVEVGLKVPPGVRVAVEKLVGYRQATRMCMEARMLSTDQAHAIGLVDETADSAEAAIEKSLAWCQQMLAMPPIAMLRERDYFRAPIVKASEGPEAVAEEYTELWYSEETQTAIQALMERLTKK